MFWSSEGIATAQPVSCILWFHRFFTISVVYLVVSLLLHTQCRASCCVCSTADSNDSPSRRTCTLSDVSFVTTIDITNSPSNTACTLSHTSSVSWNRTPVLNSDQRRLFHVIGVTVSQLTSMHFSFDFVLIPNVSRQGRCNINALQVKLKDMYQLACSIRVLVFGEPCDFPTSKCQHCQSADQDGKSNAYYDFGITLSAQPH